MGGRLEVRITTADVGKRVSVRSLAEPGAAGASFTDTVGVLTSWTDGVLRITRRDGESVAVAESAVVAGKVVPARPARRRGIPAASVRELQRVAARGWPPVETERLGNWTLRASAGFTTRGNSVLALGEPGMPLDDALRVVTRWYGGRGLRPAIQVATEAGEGVSGAVLADALDARGWPADRHTLLRTGALAPLADRAPDERVRLRREPTAEWLRAYNRSDGAPGDAAVRVLSGGPSVWFATVPGPADTPAAIGRCVVDGRWAGFAAVEVAPEHRRTGLATTVMAELARRALEEGASAAYLQVERSNTEARALYDALGFADHHAYHYRHEPRP